MASVSDLKEGFSCVYFFAAFVFEHYLEARGVFTMSQRQVLKRLPAVHGLFPLQDSDELFSVAAHFVEDGVDLAERPFELLADVEHVLRQESEESVLAGFNFVRLLHLVFFRDHLDAFAVHHIE